MTELQKLHIYIEMVRIRRFQNACQKQYSCGKMGGFLILSNGQESTPVVLRSIMGEHDHTITGPRGLASAIAAGIPLGPIMAELYGNADGCNSGKGGMFSFFSPAHHHWGCHATAAAQTPLAAGLAFALKYKEKKGVVFCFLGDGSINQGVFHETLNLVALWNIPVVFIIENNLYSMGTHVRRGTAYRKYLAERAEGYGMRWDAGCGWKIEDLHGRLTSARDHAIAFSRPVILEVYTYRYHGFTVADANSKKYRTPEEIRSYKQHHDPIRCWEQTLIEENLLDSSTIKTIAISAKNETSQSVNFAEKGAKPDPKTIQQGIYAQINSGRHFF